MNREILLRRRYNARHVFWRDMMFPTVLAWITVKLFWDLDKVSATLRKESTFDKGMESHKISYYDMKKEVDNFLGILQLARVAVGGITIVTMLALWHLNEAWKLILTEPEEALNAASNSLHSSGLTLVMIFFLFGWNWSNWSTKLAADFVPDFVIFINWSFTFIFIFILFRLVFIFRVFQFVRAIERYLWEE